MTEIKGIGNAKAITILAAVELGRRINLLSEKEVVLKSGNSVYKFMKNVFIDAKEEHLYGLYLNAKGILISSIELTNGLLFSSPKI